MKMKGVVQRYAVLLIGLAALVNATAVYSQEVGFPGSKFEIDTDANTIVDQAGIDRIDWNTVDEASSTEAFTGTQDDSFGQGSKEDTPVPSVVTGSIPPNKSDLKRFGLYFENVGLNEKFLHLYWTRVQDPSGTTNMDFEFNQSSTLSANNVTPVRSYLDMLVQYDLANGGTVPTMYLSFWIDGTGGETKADCEAASSLPCWSHKIDLTNADLARGSINSTAIAAADSGGLGDLSPRTFGEASINFGLLANVVSGQCVSFGSAYLKSRSSDSFTSSLKDFIAPLSQTVSNCATITILKEDDNDTALGAGIEFTLYKDLTPVGGTWNGTGINGEEDTTVAKTCTTNGSGVCTFNNVFPGDYWVVETAGTPTGYAKAAPVHVTVTGPGDNHELTIENPRLPQLKLVKATVPTTDTGKFDLSDSVEGLLVDDGGNGANSGFVYTTTGAHTVSEAAGTGSNLGNYNSSIACDSSKGSGSGTSLGITLAYGDVVTCTFTNSRLPQLKLVKATVPTTDTGKFDLSDSVEGLKVDDGGNGASSGFFNTSIGAHTVSEAAGTGSSLLDYSASISCDSSKGSGSGTSLGITLAYGDMVTCTFTNSRLPQLKLVKATVPTSDTGLFDLSDNGLLKVDDGGNGANSGFYYTTTGAHTVSEAAGTGSVLSDYNSSVSCDSSKGSGSGTSLGITLAYGDMVTCTFTNTRRGTIIVKKLAPSYDSDAAFGFSGDITASLKDGEESTGVSVAPGQYTATEAAATGWDLTQISCDDGASVSASSGDTTTRVATFNVEAGETVTCTFTNIPLTDITVEAESLVPGGTHSTISCTPEGGPVAGGNPTLTLSNKPPGTYICTVVVVGGS